MTLKLGLLRDKNKQCKSEFCAVLQPHTHSENNFRNKSLDRLLKPQLSSELLTRENELKSIYSSTYKRCREITSKAHAYRNCFKLGKTARSRSKGSIRKSQTRPIQITEIETVTSWTLHGNKTDN